MRYLYDATQRCKCRFDFAVGRCFCGMAITCIQVKASGGEERSQIRPKGAMLPSWGFYAFDGDGWHDCGCWCCCYRRFWPGWSLDAPRDMLCLEKNMVRDPKCSHHDQEFSILRLPQASLMHSKPCSQNCPCEVSVTVHSFSMSSICQ